MALENEFIKVGSLLAFLMKGHLNCFLSVHLYNTCTTRKCPFMRNTNNVPTLMNSFSKAIEPIIESRVALES